MRSDMPEPSGLDVQDVTVTYPGMERPAVHGATFRVAHGEIVALTGPSGCGKSTLLRAIAGIEHLDTGRVQWNGVDLTDVPTHKRGFGMVFQDGQLFAHRNVGENIAYGLHVQRLPRTERSARVAELLTLIGLPGAELRPVDTLSGGERQRVALARSLAPRPGLLLLDEPLSALDAELRERLALDMRGILQETDTTAILVTHDLREADAVADRSLRMRAGELVT